jgi:hypothetical protein
MRCFRSCARNTEIEQIDVAGLGRMHRTKFNGERAGTRTLDLLIKSQLLYRLSYALVTRRLILSEIR